MILSLATNKFNLFMEQFSFSNIFCPFCNIYLFVNILCLNKFCNLIPRQEEDEEEQQQSFFLDP